MPRTNPNSTIASRSDIWFSGLEQDNCTNNEARSRNSILSVIESREPQDQFTCCVPQAFICASHVRSGIREVSNHTASPGEQAHTSLNLRNILQFCMHRGSHRRPVLETIGKQTHAGGVAELLHKAKTFRLLFGRIDECAIEKGRLAARDDFWSRIGLRKRPALASGHAARRQGSEDD